MADTSIEWTQKVWNPVRGCALVSAGCKNCYAMGQAHRFSGQGQPYEGLTELGPNGPRWTGAARPAPEMLDAPLKWRKPARVFVNSMSDLFHADVPDEYIAAVFAVMRDAPRHTFQVLTKRPARMLEWVRRVEEMDVAAPDGRAFECDEWPLPNAWLGVSVENQEAANERIPLLLQTPAAVRWLSCEPLLGPVDISAWLPSADCFVCSRSDGDPVHIEAGGRGIDWVVVGGESGRNARPMAAGWARSLLQQCIDHAKATPFFFKQWGEYAPLGTVADVEDKRFRFQDVDGERLLKYGKGATGRLLDGAEWSQYPEGEV